MQVALLGYPNTGKTSVFNKLTNSTNKTANFAGVTVDIAQSTIIFDDKQQVDCIDLPGINSLNTFSDSKDELVVNKYIEQNSNSLYLNIVDIGQLKKHLLLSLAAISKNINMILVVNMIDTAKINSAELAEMQNILKNKLGLNVVMVSAKSGHGFDNLKDEIKKIINNPNEVSNNNINKFSTDTIENYKIVKDICKSFDDIKIISSKFTHILDKIVLNKFLSIPIFFFVLYALLFITLNIQIVFSGLIDELGAIYLVDGFGNILESLGAPDLIILILANGIGGGIQTMLTFIPIIFSLFFLISFLEETGYMARQAFLADGFMQKMGLPGKAFVSLVMGFGCTAATASSCRTLERESDRRLSLLISPSISCSAKLPVYIYLGVICFSVNAINLVFLLYIIGIIFAILNGLFLSKSLFRYSPVPFIVELPNYKMPKLSILLTTAFKKVSFFLIGLGKVIVPIIMLITVLNSLTIKGKITTPDADNSILAVTSSAITPVFTPIGITKDNWQATLSLITGFLAKEVVVATLNTVYFNEIEDNATEETLKEKTLGAFSGFMDQFINRDHLDLFDIGESYPAVGSNIEEKRQILLNKFNGTIGVFTFLLFILLYTPCISAMGAIAREMGGKWAWIIGLWSFFNAYIVSLLFYQLFTNFTIGICLTITSCVFYGLIFIIFKYIYKKYAYEWEKKIVFINKNNKTCGSYK